VINDSKALSKRQASSNRCAQNHRPWDNRQGGWITEGDALIEPTLGAFEVYVTLRGSKLKIHITAAAPSTSIVSKSKIMGFGLLTLSALCAAIPSAHAAVTGEQKTLVFLVNFQENPNDLPMSIEAARNLVFGTVNDFYRSASYNQMWLSGEVAGTFTVPFSNQVCNNAKAVADAVNAQAAAAGVAVQNYSRYIYLTTKDACKTEGSATVSGLPSRTLINGVRPARVFAHELGHNFGLDHSGALNCDGGSLAGQCQSVDYGDSYDTMGNYDMGYFNSFQKERLGWMSAAVAPKVTLASQDGVYTIGAYEQNNGLPIAVKIPRGVDPATGKMRWFYIEYRQSLNHDSFLAARSYNTYRGDVTEGVVVRLATEGDARSSKVLHMKPNSYFKQSFGMNDWADPAMPIGDSFTDPESGVTFSLLSANGNSADISVQMGSSTDQCVNAAPVVTAVVSSGSAMAGDTLQYSVKIENLDSAACGASDYSVNANVLSGWLSNTTTVNLAPGASQQVTLAVTSAGTSSAGSYTIPVVATSVANANSKGSANVTYQVETQSTGGTSGLVATDDLVSISSKQAVTIAVLGNDTIPVGTQVTVQVAGAAKGSVEVLNDGSVRYTPAKSFKTSDSFGYTVSDGVNSASALVTVVLATTSGGKGKQR
jgi:hypothetical protein